MVLSEVPMRLVPVGQLPLSRAVGRLIGWLTRLGEIAGTAHGPVF